MNNKNKYVFIVDNSMISANRIFNALSHITSILKVDYAASGKEALQKINNNPPNAVLLDIKLPDMNGVDMLQQIKQIYPNMVVIILTDYPTSHSFKISKALGVHGYYNKANELDTAIKQLQKLTK